jgi:uncharacterized phage-associated protein
MHVLDVAAFLVRQHGPMSAMKLQKLVYYGQAWSLALHARPLFEQDVQAWAYGPVVYDLFKQHRGRFVVSGATVQGDATCVDHEPEARDLLDRILSSYGTLDGARLSDLTHSEEPWLLARQVTPDGGPSQAVISHASMRAFYGRQPPPWQQLPARS